MVLVDSSVWIDFFTGRTSPQTRLLLELLPAERLLTGDLVLAEVLSGLEPSDLVVLHPSDRVAPGVRVAARGS